MSGLAQIATTRRDPPGSTKVGVIGTGVIGSAVIRALRAGSIEGVVLTVVVDNRPAIDCPVPQVSLEAAIDQCDVLVECAGQACVASHATRILESGVDLLITSVGAMADPQVADEVLAAGPGRVIFTAGAVGGLDMLASASAFMALRSAKITTTKTPASLVQPWMDEAATLQLLRTDTPVEVFRGGAREAARLFPRSLNVAATVAFAIDDFDLVEVVLVADPDGALTSHLIEAEGDAGEYRFEIKNRPSALNPRTSGVVPYAVLRTLAVLVGRPVRIV